VPLRDPVYFRSSQVEVRGLRYDYMRRAFEAREIYVPETVITFRITDGYRFFQVQWTQVSFFAFVHQLVIESGITRFALYPLDVSAAKD
jgi:hypothetical protein